MEVYKGTGVVKTAELRVQKSVHALIICSTRNPQSLTNETISVWIEKANGSNFEIATNINLRDFIIGSTYGNEAIQATDEFQTIALCEITDGDGAYPLAEGESLKFKLEGLISTETYAINALEDPYETELLLKFERKTVASEDFSKKIQTTGFDLAVITDADSKVRDYVLRYSNGQTVKYTPFELAVISRDVDPVAYVGDDGIVSNNLGRLVVPLGGEIDEIEVNKDNGGAPVIFVLRSMSI
jgi:hypothetical protein